MPLGGNWESRVFSAQGVIPPQLLLARQSHFSREGIVGFSCVPPNGPVHWTSWVTALCLSALRVFSRRRKPMPIAIRAVLTASLQGDG